MNPAIPAIPSYLCRRLRRLALMCLAACAWCGWGAVQGGGSGQSPQESAAPNAELRDPFWPINYKPPRPAAPGALATDQDAAVESTQALPPDTEARAEAMAALKVGGVIRRGRLFFAAVNGQMVQVGDVIAVPHEGRYFRFRIRSIDMRKVQIEPAD